MSCIVSRLVLTAGGSHMKVTDTVERMLRFWFDAGRGTPRRYPYFDVVEGLAWSYEAESYAGGSICYW